MQSIRICVYLVLSGLVHDGTLATVGQPELIRQPPFPAAAAPLGQQQQQQPSGGCHRRLYTYRIEQTDGAGRRCRDRISVWACVGECVSQQIADWRFPHRVSNHPVCVHAQRSKAVAILRECDAGVAAETRRHEYVEADRCQCQICTSSDTKCVAPRPGPSDRDSVSTFGMNEYTD